VPVTLKDVTQKVGYSVTTVSRDLTEYDDVAELTRQLILRIATETEYHSNVTARRLQKRRTDTIGFIISTMAHALQILFSANSWPVLATQPLGGTRSAGLYSRARSRGVESLRAYGQGAAGRRLAGRAHVPSGPGLILRALCGTAAQ